MSSSIMKNSSIISENSISTIENACSPPKEYLCPISLSLMTNPLRNKKTGHHFERESIMEWIYRGNTKCPLTRKSLHPDDLVPDTKLQAKILSWKMEQDFSESSHHDDFGLDDSDADFEAAFSDILEISASICNATRNAQQQHRQQSEMQQAPAPRTTSSPPAAAAASVASSSSSSNSLQDIRRRVLQKRDDRIKNALSKAPSASRSNSTSVGSDDMDNMSLAQLMYSRV